MFSALPLDTHTPRHLAPAPEPAELAHPGEPVGAPAPARAQLFAVPALPDASDGETDDAASSVPRPHPDFVRSLAIVVFEVVEGLRSSTQLGAAVTLSAVRRLGALCAARRDQLAVLRDAPRSVQRAGSVRIDMSVAGIAETATVLHVGARARSVAIRLEWIGRRWRATELVVL